MGRNHKLVNNYEPFFIAHLEPAIGPAGFTAIGANGGAPHGRWGSTPMDGWELIPPENEGTSPEKEAF